MSGLMVGEQKLAIIASNAASIVNVKVSSLQNKYK